MSHRNLPRHPDGKPDEEFDLRRSLEQNGITLEEAHTAGAYGLSSYGLEIALWCALGALVLFGVLGAQHGLFD